MSNINYAAITTTYPVAGVDNDSQGFRDNFTAISAGLATAKTEITALQTNAIIVADLATSTTPVVNNLLQSTISNGLYKQFYGTYFDGGTVPTSANIDLTNGPVQKFTLSGTPTLTFTNWPVVGQSGYVKVHIASDQSGVRYPVFATSNAGTIHYDTSYPTNPITSARGFTVGGESVTQINMSNVGSGYTSPATVSFSGGNPITGYYVPQGTAVYTVVSATVVGGSGGSGYVTGDTITLNANPNVVFTVTASSGIITAVSVTLGGTFTTPLSTVQNTSPLSSAAGTGARLVLSFGVSSITVTNSGDGYTTVAPNVSVSAPGSGTTALANAVLSTLTSTRVKVIEAWSNNAGADVYVRYLGEY
jgi:hypothetical protein